MVVIGLMRLGVINEYMHEMPSNIRTKAIHALFWGHFFLFLINLAIFLFKNSYQDLYTPVRQKKSIKLKSAMPQKGKLKALLCQQSTKFEV